MVVGPGAEVLHVQVRVLGREAADDVRDRDAPDIVLRVDAEIADGLEVDALHGRHVRLRVLHDGPQVAVVLARYHAADQHDGEAGRGGVLHGALFDAEHGPAVLCVIGLLVHGVKAQIGGGDAVFAQLAAELRALRQLDAVGVELYEPETQVPGQPGELHDVAPHGRLAAAELHGRVLARSFTVMPQQPLALGEARLVQRLVRVAREAHGAAHVAAAGGHQRRRGGQGGRRIREGGPREGALHLFHLVLGQ